MLNNIIELLIENKRKNPSGIALADRDNSYTWEEVWVKVQKMATFLLEKKICIPNGNKPIPVLIHKH